MLDPPGEKLENILTITAKHISSALLSAVSVAVAGSISLLCLPLVWFLPKSAHRQEPA